MYRHTDIKFLWGINQRAHGGWAGRRSKQGKADVRPVPTKETRDGSSGLRMYQNGCVYWAQNVLCLPYSIVLPLPRFQAMPRYKHLLINDAEGTGPLHSFLHIPGRQRAACPSSSSRHPNS